MSTPEREGPARSAPGRASEADAPAPPSATALLVTVLLIGTCGLVYELLAGTVASYLLGDSVTQFSTVIGVYLFAMGAGAWLSSAIHRDVAARFVEVEVGVALVGGSSSALLFLAFSRGAGFQAVLYGLVFVVGALVGLEIPLLMRILKDRFSLEDLVARVLTFDYVGALVASVAFPLFIVPQLGLMRGSFAVGMLNALVGLWCTHLLRDAFERPRAAWFLRVEAGLTLVVLGAGFIFSDALISLSEDRMYADPVVSAKTTPYQRIVVTRGRSSFQLYLNGNLQLSSFDEHRYHEGLVHPAVAARARLSEEPPRRALVLGGGDGMALRELLRYPSLSSITLVELDPEMTELSKTHPLFVAQNEGALLDPRVEVVHADAMVWLHERQAKESPVPAWDVIVVDFPDPNTYALGKLYTTRFYRLLRTALAEHGVAVIQSTSPHYARRSFWCVRDTLEAAGWSTRAYHVAVPSFGEWGFVLAAKEPLSIPTALALPAQAKLRFLDAEALVASFVFSRDMAEESVGPNRLDNQILVRIYDEEWSRYQ